MRLMTFLPSGWMTRPTCVDVRHLAAEKLTDVEEKIAELQNIREALPHLTDLYQDEGPTSECPILDAMEGS